MLLFLVFEGQGHPAIRFLAPQNRLVLDFIDRGALHNSLGVEVFAHRGYRLPIIFHRFKLRAASVRF